MLNIVNRLMFVCVGGWRGWGVGGVAVWMELETAAGSVDVADLLHACKLSLYVFFRTVSILRFPYLPTKPGEVLKVTADEGTWSDAMPVTAIVPEARSRRHVGPVDLLLVAFHVYHHRTILYPLCLNFDRLLIYIWFGLSESCIFCTWSLLYSINFHGSRKSIFHASNMKLIISCVIQKEGHTNMLLGPDRPKFGKHLASARWLFPHAAWLSVLVKDRGLRRSQRFDFLAENENGRIPLETY